MNRLAALALLALAGCATQQVTSVCQDAQALAASPAATTLPPDLQLLATGIRVGSLVCGSPEYAAARDKIAAFIRSKAR